MSFLLDRFPCGCELSGTGEGERLTVWGSSSPPCVFFIGTQHIWAGHLLPREASAQEGGAGPPEAAC